MKSFKTFLAESMLAKAAAAAGLVTSSAMAAPPKPEAIEKLVPYLKQKEGYREVAELDKDATGNPPVVGYGTTHVYPDTGKPIKVGDKITPEKAEEYIRQHLTKMTPQLEKIPDWDNMTAGQQAALMSFGQNLGSDFYRPNAKENEKFYSISQALKNKEWDKVPGAMNLYVKGGGKVLPGLVTRRSEEGAMWSEKDTDTSKDKPPVPEKDKPNDDASEYSVNKGDTMWAISRKHGISLDELVKKNPQIKDPASIKPGDKVKIR